MLLKMVGQGLVMAAIIAALSYGYQTYRADRLDGTFVSVQESDE